MEKELLNRILEEITGLKQDQKEMRIELEKKIDDTKEELRAELKQDIQDVRAELKQDIQVLKKDIEDVREIAVFAKETCETIIQTYERDRKYIMKKLDIIEEMQKEARYNAQTLKQHDIRISVLEQKIG